MDQHDRNAATSSGGPSPTVPARDLTGRTLADFHVERLLGHGGMGEVYLARQLSLDRLVALKVLRPELLSNPTTMARFESEAWAAAKLNHPNIVHIYTLGSVDGTKFIAMEYVKGTNLREYLTKKGVPELPLALSVMKQAGQAVGAAGEVGLIHRDIKPENLLLTRKGQVKVADFGLCRGPDADRLHLTQPGTTLGTPLYMSPEQVEGKPLDSRSDLYSLGVTFYHMLAGVPPFTGDSPLALALRHVRDQPMSLAVHRPDLPKELVDLVMKLLAKKPSDRYQSAAEMLRDLAKLKERLQTSGALGTTRASLPTATLPASVAESGETSEEPDEDEVEAPARRRLEIAWPQIGAGTIAALSLGGVLVGAAWGWMGRSPELLGRNAPPGTSLPGLWVADWRAVAERPTPHQQYRYAQTGGLTSAQRVAAWLAVPGYHPNSSGTAFRAYVQLARELFQQGEADRLDALADELASWGEGKPDGPNWRALAVIAHAGASSIRDDATAVQAQFGQIANFEALDPSVAELGLEVVLGARRRPSGAGPGGSRLADLTERLLVPLDLDFATPQLRNPGPMGFD